MATDAGHGPGPRTRSGAGVQAQTLPTWLEINKLGHLWSGLNRQGYYTIVDFMITPWETLLDDLSDSRATFPDRKHIYELRKQFAAEQKMICDQEVSLLVMKGVSDGIIKHTHAKNKLITHVERMVFDVCPVDEYITLDGEQPVLILRLFRAVSQSVVTTMADRLKGVMKATCKVHASSSLFPFLQKTADNISLEPLPPIIPDDDALLNAFDETLLGRFCDNYGYDYSHLGTKDGLARLAVSIATQIRPLVPTDERVNVYDQAQGPLRGKDNLKIGDVVTLVGLRIGTIKYIGKVKGSFNKNYGVQLHTHKGNCSGDVDGENYFECPPQMGIFVERTGISGRCTSMLKSLSYIDFDVNMEVLEKDDDQDFYGPPFWQRGRARKDLYTVAPPKSLFS